MKITRRQLTILKTVLHLLALFPLLWLLFALVNNTLGGDPAKEIQHFTGLTALKLLLATLLVSPLAHYSQTALLMRCRRLLGLWCFAWACLHLTSYAVLELGLDLRLLASEVTTRPYLIVGIVAWSCLLSLAVTSTQWAQNRMGKYWQRLHFLVYLIAILVPIHYLWSVKTLSPQPIIYAALATLLLCLRLPRLRRSGQKPVR